MIPVSLTSALANHLWQSTVFAGAVGVLTLALRHNQARTRHWLWLTASMKFLIPFSLLSAIGGRFGFLTAGLSADGVKRPAVSIVSGVVGQITQPFPQWPLPAAGAPEALTHHTSLLPLLLAIWACGFLVVTFRWWREWRRIAAVVLNAEPLAIEAVIPVLSSPGALEPGVFGIFRPVLLLPEGIADRMEPAHLAAILAHELCHVRRRDNVAAALHMAVEAVFWFHPLVWWIGARLVEERERACDEEVIRLGNRPQTYAESILKTCQFYVESPLACMSGISGSDLKKRITRIMTHQLTTKLSFGRKLLLAVAGIAAVAGPIVFGLMNAAQGRAQSPTAKGPSPAFEVVSIKPDKSGNGRTMIGMEPGGRFVAENIAVNMLLQEAYDVKDSQVSGAPGWVASEHYDINAKGDEAAALDKNMTDDERKAQFQQMLQSMLADRFKLVVHHEAKEQQTYALTVGKSGPKFHASVPTPDDQAPPDTPVGPDGKARMRRGVMMRGRGDLEISAANLDMFANVLSRQLGRLVVNKTGLKGDYDFTLKWTPDEGQGQMFHGAGGSPGEGAPPPEAAGPSIFTAIQEQLGLKLESQKGPVDTIVIDHIERPSEN